MKSWLLAAGNWFDARLKAARNPAADAGAPHPPGGGRADGLVVRLRQRVA